MKKHLPWIVGLPLVVLAGFWLSFGTLSPCEAMRLEARRVAEKEGGFLGRAILSTIVEAKTDTFTPIQCAATAVRLKVSGKEALKLLIVGDDGGDEGKKDD